MNDRPKVSVALITYNHAAFVAQAIEGVLMQDCNFEYEIIIGDDCSTDNTPEILKSFQAEYPDKIHLLLNSQNVGMHKNFEQTYFTCRGEYIALLEGDDYWTSSQKLQKQVDFLDQHSEYALCFHNSLVKFEDNRQSDYPYCPPDLQESLTIHRLLESNCIATASVLYRHGLVAKIPDWVYGLKAIDWPLHLLHAEYGKIGYLNELMSVYRIHENGSWSSRNLTWQIREVIKILDTVNQGFEYKYETTIDKSLNYFYDALLSAYDQESQSSIPLKPQELSHTEAFTPDKHSISDMHNEGLIQAEPVALDAQASELNGRVSYGSLDESLYFPEGDYISPGLQQIKPDRCFPHMLIGYPLECSWPFLRREIPHNWYVDQRYPKVGFINRDEAHILYNSALLFQGKRGLEVGCWMGWSACHIALAGVELDVIDPRLEKPEFFGSVRDSLKKAGVLSSVRLIPGTSPDKVEELADREQRRWSFMFIDGDHESPGPLNDVRACEPFAEADALILFHDLVSPGVAEGLEYLRRKGWKVMIYHTMQIMGVAWRGNVEPVVHQPDPTVYWQVPGHLRSFDSDLPPQVLHPDNPELNQHIEAITGSLQAELDWLRLQLKASQESYWQAQGEKEWVEAEYQKASEKMDQNEAELGSLTSQFQDIQAQLQSTSEQLEAAKTRQSTLAAKLKQSTDLVAYQQQRLLQVDHDYLPRLQTEQTIHTLKSDLEQAQGKIANLKEKIAKKNDRVQFQKANLEQRNTELADAKARIAAMETSKFWKLRKVWFVLKRSIGLAGRE